MNSEKRVVFEKYVVEIVNFLTGKVVEVFGLDRPMTREIAEVSERTILHNLNKDKYFVRTKSYEEKVMELVDNHFEELRRFGNDKNTILGGIFRGIGVSISKELAHKIVDKVYNKYE